MAGGAPDRRPGLTVRDGVLQIALFAAWLSLDLLRRAPPRYQGLASRCLFPTSPRVCRWRKSALASLDRRFREWWAGLRFAYPANPIQIFRKAQPSHPRGAVSVRVAAKSQRPSNRKGAGMPGVAPGIFHQKQAREDPAPASNGLFQNRVEHGMRDSWRSHPNWWQQNAGGFFLSGVVVIVDGCFRVGASVRKRTQWTV